MKMNMRPYEKDPAAIYAASFAAVRREARLERFGPGMEALAVRLIHACGMVEVADRLAFSPGAFEAGQAALRGRRGGSAMAAAAVNALAAGRTEARG
jgi:precorrin-8X/cobalt-precorrin-8 methylmutase